MSSPRIPLECTMNLSSNDLVLLIVGVNSLFTEPMSHPYYDQNLTQVFVCVQLYIPSVLKEKQNSTPTTFLSHYVSHEAINSTKQLFYIGRDAFREDFFSLFSHFNNQRTISTSPMNSFTISSPEITLSDLSTMNISWSTGLSIIIASFLITFSIFLSGSTFTE